jgi:hypothetical protein
MQAVKIHDWETFTISPASTGLRETIMPAGKASGNEVHLLTSNLTGCYAPTDCLNINN